ncbi:MAG TPA: preprotein translocase subunit SecG [Candidatus Limnocylindrales bacterium]|nr:preprotein translocase subunit SecG [Candidatus Limnocylindrales bacterium]
MNPFLAVGQILVAVGLVLSILLQARGASLGAAFGGESAVYTSRRGLEKTLYRFTIVLTIVFVIFSVAAYTLTANG